MARYDYRCAGDHTTEAMRPMSVGLIDCPTCGGPAQRVAVYPRAGETFIGGDGITAHRPTREAPVNVTRFTEAHGEVLHEAEKRGVQAPDFFGIAKERVRTGAVKAYG